MAKPKRRTWTWHFAAPVEAVWPVMADTARFNEAAKLPRHDVEEIAQADGSVVYIGRARKGPVRLEWREKPGNWVFQQWFEHCRHFTRGPLAALCATLTIAAEGTGSRIDYKVEA